MTEDQEERLVDALERIANTLDEVATYLGVIESIAERLYPEPVEDDEP